MRLANGVEGILWATYGPLNTEALDAAGPQLKAISTYSAGLDYVDLAEVRQRNVSIGYTPRVLDNAVADIAVGLLIAASRRFHEARLAIEKSEWAVTMPQWMLGQDIEESTVGVVGLGNIGQAIAKRLRGFDIGRLLYSGHRPKPEAETLNAEFVPFEQLVKESDFVIIAAPLTSETRNMFNRTTFEMMKSTSVLVNIARGQIVNTADLVEALKTGQIFAAGLDVMDPEPLPADHELLTLPNCVISPHLGSATVNTRTTMALLAANNVLRGIAGREMISPAP